MATRKPDPAASRAAAAAPSDAVHSAGSLRLRRPSKILLLLEARAALEALAAVATLPLWSKGPRGDGHSVLVLPGLAASNRSTLPLRAFLKRRGWDAHGWPFGINRGPRAGVLQALRDQVRALHRTSGQPVSLIGWSLGGVYAKALAREMPDAVRCVITLGSPLIGTTLATNAGLVFRALSGVKVSDPHILTLRDGALGRGVPHTSIYSKGDGVVSWRASHLPEGPLAENICVRGSHLGLGMNARVLAMVADRLLQPRGQWKPWVAAR